MEDAASAEGIDTEARYNLKTLLSKNKVCLRETIFDFYFLVRPSTASTAW